ncbi:MAG: family 16 glycosylhydrolase [Melioribacteraceae bacterium]|nr:family 16 glycosylhydrolase [Melioribacteraceae bacterium]
MIRIKELIFVLLIFILGSSTITAQKKYWSGEVRTFDSILYGRIEIRMRTAEASGVTTTLFTYNTKSSTYNEIDIEVMGFRNTEAEFTSFTPDQKGVNHRQVLNFNPHSAFHIYAIEWTPTYVSWWVDGFEIYRDSAERIQTLNLPQAIMMNFWIPNSVEWAGAFSPSALPLYAYYDWIKYYEYTPEKENEFTFKWEDNFDTFNDSRWRKSNSTFGSNLADFKAQNVLLKDGYLMLCMTNQGETAVHAAAIPDADIDAPYPISGWIYDDKLSIKFSEPLEETSTKELSNYITPSLKISNPILSENNTRINFDVTGAKPGQSYSTAIKGIKDLAPNPNVMGLKPFSVYSAHTSPMIIDIGNPNSGNVILSEQTFDAKKEYGTGGGVIKKESGVIFSGENSSFFNDGLENINSYQHRVANGTYEVKLFFVESDSSGFTDRIFDVFINGKKVLSDFQIKNEVGYNKGLVKTFSEIYVNDNMLKVYFKSIKGYTILHGITIEQTSKTDLKDDLGKVLPTDIEMQLYPNPFNPTFNISYTLSKQTPVDITIFDSLGRKCIEVFNGVKDAGIHKLEVDPKNFSSGVFFVTLQTPQNIITQKIVHLK